MRKKARANPKLVGLSVFPREIEGCLNVEGALTHVHAHTCIVVHYGKMNKMHFHEDH